MCESVRMSFDASLWTFVPTPLRSRSRGATPQSGHDVQAMRTYGTTIGSIVLNREHVRRIPPGDAHARFARLFRYP